MPTTTSETDASLTTHPFLAGVPPEALARLSARARFVEAHPGAVVVGSEEQTNEVYFVLRGAARVELFTPGGKEVILSTVQGGDLVGEMAALDGAPRSAHVVALTRLRLAAVPAPAFVALLHEAPAARERLIAMLVGRVRELSAKMLEHDSLPVRPRLLAELLRLAKPRPGGAGELVVSPPPTRAELGARIGARREAVSREMADLLRRGVLAERRGAIVLRDPEAMRAAYRAALEGAEAGGGQ